VVAWRADRTLDQSMRAVPDSSSAADRTPVMRRAQLAAHALSTACGCADGGGGRHRSTRIDPGRGDIGRGRGDDRNPVSPGLPRLRCAHRGRDCAVRPAATVAAVSGLSAAAYLVLRHAASNGAGLDSVQRRNDGLCGGLPWSAWLRRIPVAAAMVAVVWRPLPCLPSICWPRGRICGTKVG